ncbi:MAG: ribosomal RNA small subunit methyltransferase A [Candidatus Omnitrophica bacterium]|nr:ribosomal RNA small subunit methyltransferase A [Candidatus Omnitrophota bacterium]
MLTAGELQALLKAHELRLTKRRGQNFLVEANQAKRLVASCHLAPQDTVIEIGAGLGALTDLLAHAAGRVIAVESDRALSELLQQRMAHHSHVEVMCQDILSFPWSRDAGSAVVGMIPYVITSPILVTLCEHAAQVRGAWLGIQREVAQRLVARPGTKAYGRLTVLVQYYFEVKELLRIPRHVFFPQPNVDSSWVSLKPRARPAVEVGDEPLFFAVVQAAFAQRRKTLVNGLHTLQAPTLSRAEAVQLVRQLGWSERVRGETLSLAQFAQLTAAVQNRGHKHIAKNC